MFLSDIGFCLDSTRFSTSAGIVYCRACFFAMNSGKDLFFSCIIDEVSMACSSDSRAAMAIARRKAVFLDAKSRVALFIGSYGGFIRADRTMDMFHLGKVHCTLMSSSVKDLMRQFNAG